MKRMLHCKRYGAGRPLVILHGLFGSKRNWSSIAAKLAAHHRVVTVDLRNQPDAVVGDELTLWGEGLPVEEIAEAAGTISYELTCSITRRVRFQED